VSSSSPLLARHKNAFCRRVSMSFTSSSKEPPKKVDSNKRPSSKSSSSVGDAFGRIWECYCACLSFSLSFASPIVLLLSRVQCFPKKNARSFVGVGGVEELTFFPSRRRRRLLLLSSLERPTHKQTTTAPRFQLTKYYRYGEMDSCERFWDAFYAAMDRNATTTPDDGSKEEKGRTTTATTTTTTTTRASDKDASDDKEDVGTTSWHWTRWRRREDERDIRAFERAWEIVDPAVAKASWTRRYRDVFVFDDDDDDESGVDNT
jgi:hypothetical protein